MLLFSEPSPQPESWSMDGGSVFPATWDGWKACGSATALMVLIGVHRQLHSVLHLVPSLGPP